MKLPIRLPALLVKRENETTNPSRDWLILLAVSFIVFIISIVWNSLFFFSVVQEPEQTTLSGDTPDAHATIVEEVRAAAEARAEEEVRYKDEYRFVDPSR